MSTSNGAAYWAAYESANKPDRTTNKPALGAAHKSAFDEAIRTAYESALDEAIRPAFWPAFWTAFKPALDETLWTAYREAFGAANNATKFATIRAAFFAAKRVA